jgi:hypothetical protein
MAALNPFGGVLYELSKVPGSGNGRASRVRGGEE